MLTTNHSWQAILPAHYDVNLNYYTYISMLYNNLEYALPREGGTSLLDRDVQQRCEKVTQKHLLL